MYIARFAIAGALGFALFGPSVLASPGSPVAPSAREQPKAAPDLLAQAERLVTKISSQLYDNESLEFRARDSRDSLRLGCVENQLVASRALVEASQTTFASLRTAIRSGRDGEATPLYQVLVSLASESNSTHDAAAGCVGSKDLAARRMTMPGALPLTAPRTDRSVGKFGSANPDVTYAYGKLDLLAGSRPIPASP